MHYRSFVVLTTMMAFSAAALGHGASDDSASPKHRRASAAAGEETPFGRPGDARNVTRTVPIVGTDDMRYTPDRVRVRQGETIRFVIRNAGKILHETVLGTKGVLDAHYAMMKKFPEMEHDEPHMVHLKPSETGEIVWQFTEPGEFHFACLVPGHWEAGMAGRIHVASGSTTKKE